MEYDVFISHASENKADVALPLANLLRDGGIKVWLDSFELKLGDSLRRSIDHGLAVSRYGVVILSPEFFKKEWPQRELDGLAAREIGIGKVILPIWHNITHDEIVRYSPNLADRLAVSTTHGLEYVAQQILDVIREEPEPLPLPVSLPRAIPRANIQPQDTPAHHTSKVKRYYGPLFFYGVISPLPLLIFVYLFIPNDFLSKFDGFSFYVVLGIYYFFLGIFCGYMWPQLKWKSGLALTLGIFGPLLILTTEVKDSPEYLGQILGIIASVPLSAIIGSLLGSYVSNRNAT